MKGARGFHLIRHILVALDASSHSRAALGAAVELAAAFRADVRGLFVEDIELLALGGLPAAEVGVYSAGPRPLSRRYLEQQLRALARRAEAMLAEVAGPRQVRWTFHTVRGQVHVALLEATPEHDIVCLGVAGRSAVRGQGLGSTARAALRSSSKPLLVVRRGTSLRPPVAAVCLSSRVAPALQMAAGLREALGGRLMVLAAGPQSPARAEAWLAEHGVPALLRRVPGRDAETVARAVAEVGAGVVVMAAESASPEPAHVEWLLWRTGVPVLWVRP